MKYKHLFLLMALIGILASCDLLSSGDDSTDGTDGTSGGDQLAKEVADAKAFYTKQGAQFKFRVYAFNGDLNNRHEMYLQKIFERNGKISFISESWTTFGGTSFTYKINASGELILDPTIGGNQLNPANENEINAEDQLVVYQYGSGAVTHGAYGNSRGVMHNLSTQKIQQTPMNNSEQGYLLNLKGKSYVFSMGLNSNTGFPSLYTFVPGVPPAADRWDLTDLPNFKNVGINFTNDASKAGNPNKVFWTWVSYDAVNTTNGKIHCVSFDGSNFSAITSKSIGPVGETLSMEKKHMPVLYKNPNNLDQPYIVVRRWNNQNILDIYKYTGTAIETVAEGVSLPTTLPASNGVTREYKEIAFTGNNVYLIARADNKLYRLKGKDWEVIGQNLLTGENKFTAIEGGADGLYLGISYLLQNGNLIRIAGDLVFLKN
ncbi:hypothetical protein D0X99_11740 [Algoriphagus lacus]|uniref:Lipoprotein n=1 Tax=Algoriphagus lacus TaxID=2056311 RepID=A0A418PR98_9BACT|nr:hypothetical protein [Algoriphagus lacus]RIW15111.1 hypothetical protein D0X99_11740 [Algoriphagus lacus]